MGVIRVHIPRRSARVVWLSSLCSLCLCGSSLFGADAGKQAKVTYDEHVLPLLRDKCVARLEQVKKL